MTSFKTVGSATAYLSCKSESGRTMFNAEIQDIDGGIEKAELTIDGVKLNFTEDENSNIVFDSKNGVYTIVIESKSQLKKDFSKFKLTFAFNDDCVNTIFGIKNYVWVFIFGKV